MRRALVPLAAGGCLVVVVAIVLLVVGWDWAWFTVANGALAALLLVLFRGSVTGGDENRPPGVARVSAARWAGPVDPDVLAAREAVLEPDREAAETARADELRTGFAFLWSALPPAAAAVLAIVFYL